MLGEPLYSPLSVANWLSILSHATLTHVTGGIHLHTSLYSTTHILMLYYR